MLRNNLAASLIAIGIATPAWAAPTLMSGEWAKAACEAWNKDEVLTERLVFTGWVDNDRGRGFKIMRVYRTDCGDAPTAELRVARKDEKAICVYGGAPQADKLDSGVDYVMKAETARWVEMGRGDYGPMKAMFTSRLGFEGPKLEAMGNMGPFANFLLLVGKVPSETGTCPGK
ncbi:MAG: sterol-binding protein [Burkholderiales bacterium]|nr:MAG: sterol-binding protein [Burkholderiales bacterium]